MVIRVWELPRLKVSINSKNLAGLNSWAIGLVLNKFKATWNTFIILGKLDKVMRTTEGGFPKNYFSPILHDKEGRGFKEKVTKDDPPFKGEGELQLPKLLEQLNDIIK